MTDLGSDDDFVLQESSRVPDGLFNVLGAEMGIGFEDVLTAGSLRDQLQKEGYADPRALDAGLTSKDVWVCRDAVEHVDILSYPGRCFIEERRRRFQGFARPATDDPFEEIFRPAGGVVFGIV
jgi:hypothetical protein